MTDTMILIAGQSNALGFGNSGPAPYVPTARVQIWTDTNGDGEGDAFNYMNPGVNTGSKGAANVWGPEVEFANRWLADNPEGYLWLGKVARGSTGLAQASTDLDWSPYSNGEMFDRATHVAQNMQANIGQTLDGVLWMQGESDAYDEGTAWGYGLNLKELFAAIRSEWFQSGQDAEIVFGKIGMQPPFADVVRYQQHVRDVMDPHATAIETVDFGFQPDGLHYSATGHVQLGGAFYEGWVA